MKILIVHNTYQRTGGEDFVMESEANLLQKYGHQVEKMIYRNDDIHSIGDKIKTAKGLFYNRESAKKLEKVINTFHPDVIHVHNIFYLASPSIFYEAKKLNIPVVLTLHNYRLICPGALLLRDAKVCELCVHKTFPIAGIKYGCHRGSSLQTAQLTLMTGIHKVLNTWKNKVDRYIALTEFARQRILDSSLKLSPEQVLVKPNFVEDMGEAPYSQREPFFLFIGRLSEEKGIHTLMEALHQNPFPLEVIGDGPLRAEVEKAESSLPNVKFWGFKDKAFIAERLGKCSALIFPSIWYEGMPLTLLEAFSRGTPVISSDMNNINMIVKNGHNGIHFQSGNARDLTDTISHFSKKRDQYRDFYVQARNDYDTLYSPQANYQQLVQIYESLFQSARVKVN